MKIQEKDENKLFDKDGVVWDLTTWIIFYSLLPWFAGEILSSQVVKFIGGPQENRGKVGQRNVGGTNNLVDENTRFRESAKL